MKPESPTGLRSTSWLALFCCVLLAGISSSWAAPGVTAWLDRETVAVGENVILTLTFDGAAPPSAPNLPALPNLQLVGVRATTSMNAVNGQATTQRAYSYTFAPLQPGNAVIPAMQFQLNNQVIRTEPLTLKITPAPELPPAAANGAFLKLVTPKTNIFRGEVLPVEIILYVVMGNNAQMPQLEAQGFTLGNIIQQPQRSQVRFGNQTFASAAFRSYVTAARNGSLTLGPATMMLQIPAPNSRRSIFGELVDWQRVTLQSEAIPIQVTPLPNQNVPAGFNGAVGSYTLSVTAGPTNLSVGDPITVKLKLTGKGVLDSLTLPDQPQWREFKTYAPSSTVESSDPHHLTGTKNFEQVIIPLNHEIKALPPVQFSYFDSDQKAYRTLSNSLIPLAIKPAATANVPILATTNAADKGDAAPAVDDILHIKAQAESHSATSAPLLAQGWFLALQTVPVAGWLALLVTRKRNEALANNPRRQRQRLVEARVRSGFRELRTLAAEQKSDEFHVTLFRLLQEQLGERLDLPASAITEAVVTERLQTQLSEQTQRDLHDLFQACNQAKYASQKSQVELAVLLTKAENACRDLQALKT